MMVGSHKTLPRRRIAIAQGCSHLLPRVSFSSVEKVLPLSTFRKPVVADGIQRGQQAERIDHGRTVCRQIVCLTNCASNAPAAKPELQEN